MLPQNFRIVRGDLEYDQLRRCREPRFLAAVRGLSVMERKQGHPRSQSGQNCGNDHLRGSNHEYDE